MKYRKLGSTGLAVSEVVFGGGFVGGILLHAPDDTKRQALRMAFDAGVNWIDTAPSYGQGQSEEVIGELLSEMDDAPVISTKVGLDTENLNDIQGQVEASIEASLKRLKRSSVDVLQLHNPVKSAAGDGAVSVDDVLRDGGAADALDRVREQGFANFIGFTALGEAAPCREVIASGRFDSAQVYYNMINPSAALAPGHSLPVHDFGGIIDACRDRGMAIMAIRIFAAGVLATNERHGREIPVTADFDMAREEEQARRAWTVLGVDDEGNSPHGTRAQAALRYVLSNSDVSCAVFGLAELGHLEQIIEAENQGSLPEDVLADLQDLYG